MKSINGVVIIIAMAIGLGLLLAIYFIGGLETNRWWSTIDMIRSERIDTDLRPTEEERRLVGSLTFHLKDVQQTPLPIQACDVVVQIHSSELTATMEKRLTLNLNPRGVITVPKPYPSQGRIRIWVTADAPSLGALKGYKNLAYQISNGGISWTPAPNDLEMSPCPVITGSVTDAATGLPVANVVVAPMRLGHHSNFARWDKAVRTDSKGHYRILEEYHDGVAVRHPDYAEQKTDTENTRVDFALEKLVTYRIRVVDPNGNAIPKVVLKAGSSTNSEGLAVVRVLPGSGDRLLIYHADYRWAEIDMGNLNEFEEFRVVMQELPSLKGRIIDEDGLPLDKGKVEVVFESEYRSERAVEADGPHQDGTWSLKSRQMDSAEVSGHLRISDENRIRLIQAFSIDNAKADLIESRLSIGYQFQANLVASRPLDTKSMPVAFLYRDEDYWSAVVPDDNGLIEFGALPNGSYTLMLEHPVKLTPRGMSSTNLSAVMQTGPDRNEKLAYSSSFDVENADVDLGEIDMDAQGLTPGTVVGQVFATSDESTPLPNWIGYLCHEKSDFNTVGVFDYYLEFQMDQQGRFRIDNCPPGTYMIRISDQPDRSSGEFQVTVPSGKTTEVQVFNSAKSKG